jgi:hypothetical protein
MMPQTSIYGCEKLQVLLRHTCVRFQTERLFVQAYWAVS